MESTLTKVQCKKYFFTTEWRNRNWFSDFFYKINVLCHSCEWKLKGQKNKMREEFSMLLFLYSRVMEINYTTAISKKSCCDWTFKTAYCFPRVACDGKISVQKVLPLGCSDGMKFALWLFQVKCLQLTTYMDPIQMNHLDTRIVTTL